MDILKLVMYFQVLVVMVVLALASSDRIITFAFGNLAFFDPWIYSCDANTIKENHMGVFYLVDLTVTTVIPCISICCNNFYLIYMAVKLSKVDNVAQRARPRTKGTVTVILVCCTYLMSFFPFMAAVSVSYTHNGERGWMFIIANSATGINVIVNPLIYTLTNKRFCSFMKLMVRGKSVKFRTSTDPELIGSRSSKTYRQCSTLSGQKQSLDVPRHFSWSSVQTDSFQKRSTEKLN